MMPGTGKRVDHRVDESRFRYKTTDVDCTGGKSVRHRWFLHDIVILCKPLDYLYGFDRESR
jgi:hypothetical protein